MKQKIIWISLLAFFLIVGCRKEDVVKEPIRDESEREEQVEQYVDENPIVVGLYKKENEKRTLLQTYATTWNLNVDLGVFSTFYTNESEISGLAIKDVWNEFYNKYQNIENYKIGYMISFETQNQGKLEKVIRNPEDTQGIYDYIQVYLYDDIHQEVGAFYTHVEVAEENTLLTSIKLTGSTFTHEITSPIELTVFTYDEEDDFDSETGMYRGKSSFKMIINKA